MALVWRPNQILCFDRSLYFIQSNPSGFGFGHSLKIWEIGLRGISPRTNSVWAFRGDLRQFLTQVSYPLWVCTRGPLTIDQVCNTSLGRIMLYKECLKVEVRFSLFYEYIELLRFFRISSCSIAMNFWCFICGFIAKVSFCGHPADP